MELVKLSCLGCLGMLAPTTQQIDEEKFADMQEAKGVGFAHKTRVDDAELCQPSYRQIC